MTNHEALYLTGLDEHGQKAQQKTEEVGTTPQTYADGMVTDVKRFQEMLEISYGKLIRTADDYHEKVITGVFEKLLTRGDTYLGEYSGWYSTSDKKFFTENQSEEVFRDENGKVIGGIAPSGHEVEWVSEKPYFLCLGKYADRLVESFHTHPDFTQPGDRMNEIIRNFIELGLKDLAVSRTSLTWGVKVFSDPKHVVYMWIDALFNYATALGCGQEERTSSDRFQNEGTVFHIVDKDVLRFCSTYWPAMLMILNMKLPDRLIARGWFVMKDSKMSKSRGSAVYPEILVERCGSDPLRYYLVRSLPVGSDGTFTPEDYVGRINYELANDLGNLLDHTVAMINKYFDGDVPVYIEDVTASDADLAGVAGEKLAEHHKQVNAVDYPRAFDTVWNVILRTNKYIGETAPWVLAKDDAKRDELAVVMAHLAANLHVVAHLIRPLMMTASNAIMGQLGLGSDFSLENPILVNFPKGIKVVAKGTPAFPHLNIEAKIDYIKANMGRAAAVIEEKEWNPVDVELKNEKKAIKFDDSDRVEIRVAEAREVLKIGGFEKLPKLRPDAGDEEDCQVLSGTAEFYPNEQELIGKKSQIVANLRPRKMMGLLSRGMILSAEHDGGLAALTTDPSVPNGSQIG